MKLFSFLLLALSLFLPIRLAAFPDKPIRVIVPTSAGGGHDTMARIFQRAIEEQSLLSEKLVVVNIPGAGGALGTRKIKDSPSDGYTIGIWNPALVTAKLMGITDYDHSDYEIIAMTGYTDLGLGVKTDSSLSSFEALLSQSREAPGSVKVATEIGTATHFVPLIVAEKAGLEFRMIPSGSGSKRLASILGGHTDLALFSTLALINYSQSGLKPIVLFSEERNPLLPDTPTAKERGIDISLTESRIWLAPKGTSQDRLNVIRTALKTAMALPETKRRFEDLGITPIYGDPSRAQSDLDAMRTLVQPIMKQLRR